MLKLRNATLPLALASALVVGILAGGAPAGASVPVPSASIDKIGTDAMGADTAANAYREYILIKNDTTAPVNVEGWSTQDSWANTTNGDDVVAGDCNTAVFTPANLRFLDPDNSAVTGDQPGLWLPAGETITVYSGGSSDNVDDRDHFMSLNRWSCGLHGHYLNNNNDIVYLRNADGGIVDQKGYNFHGGYTVD